MGFSQNSEEEAILKYFGDHIGTFLDIGCNDCKTFSNTHALALRGWSGVVIDASPKAIEKCKALYEGRKDIHIYQWAISKQFKNDGKAILHESGELIHQGDVGLVSTFHAHEMDRFRRSVKYEPVEVRTFKWKTAYNRIPIKKYHFVSIDIESDEMNVLPDMDLSDTKLLCIEHNGSAERKKEYLDCTSKFGLDKVIYESAENILICKS